MLRLVPPGKRKDNPFFLVQGTVNGRRIEVSAKTRDRRTAETFKADLEAELIADEGTTEIAFGDAARFYLSWRRPGTNDRRYIDKLVTVLGDRPVKSVRQHDLVTVANLLHPNATNATKNRQVLGPAAANPIKAEAVENLIGGFVFAGCFFAGGVVLATIAAILHRQLL
jgi:hypothetical protein